MSSRLIASTLLIGLLLCFSAGAAGSARTVKIAAKTQVYSDKQGFERDRKDIINTLKNNEVTSFQTLLDGLQQAFQLDKTLREPGPFTVFAPSDKAFAHLNDEDLHTLFDDKKKLKRVLMYHIVPQKLGYGELRGMSSVKTMEGHEVRISQQHGDLYIDGSLVSTTDIPCSNGVIHVIEKVMMPPVSP